MKNMKNMTAKVSCFARAYHHKHNDVHIFDDYAAEQLLGEEYDQIAQNMTGGVSFFFPEFKGTPEEGLRLIADRQLSPSVLARSAYCEKMLDNERRLGCRQYILFASGYDTYSIRNDDGELSVFELDLPDILSDKRERIEKAGLKSNANYVPCDLATDLWKVKLEQSGFKFHDKSFGSLLGISYYLSRDEFRNLLCGVSGIMAKGSAICFDYPSDDESKESKTNRMLAQGAGEKMKAMYSYSELERLLHECGFLIYEHLDNEEMTKQYFSDYNNANPEHGMQAPEGVAYIMAVRT